ncbi:MAG TPA: DUF4062 domain-containing protein [Thermoanaerobaculia bacterium]
MDQSLLHVFVSCLHAEGSSLRALAFTSCVRSGLDPYFFDWELVKGASALEAFLERRLEECQLFIGIYEKEYGKRILHLKDSAEKISPLEFELQVALRVLGPKKILLFARQVDDRDADLNRMLVKTKLHVVPFEKDPDFGLLIDEALKEWQASQAFQVRHAPRTISTKVECRDRVGILAAIYKTIYIHGGNVVRSRQITHLGIASATVIAQWAEGAESPKEEVIRESLQRELHTLLGEETGTLEVVRVIAQDGEIKAKGNFSVLFFDGPGIAERIFSVFSRSSASVLESHLVQVAANPPMAKFLIAANATNLSHEKINLLTRELKGQAGIVSVEAHMEMGSWWY